MAYPIDKNVVMPPENIVTGPKRDFHRYPLKQMEIQDSFFVPGQYSNSMRVYSSVRVHKSRTPGWNFRYVINAYGIRVWRIA